MKPIGSVLKRLSMRAASAVVVLISASFTLGAVAEDISLEGGDTTTTDSSSDAYDQPIANLSTASKLSQHDLGEKGFRRDFSKVPVRGKIRIGPKFNNVSCLSCHTKSGRGEPKFDKRGSDVVVKVSQAHGKPALPGGPIPLRSIGLQLHDHGSAGGKPDASLTINWELISGSFDDTTPFELRKPNLVIRRAITKLSSDLMFSLRRAPPVFGAGLIDAIDSDTIKALADPTDQDHDGISGRVNLVWDLSRKKKVVGKFGFKAAAPSALQQIAMAYAVDMGITNPVVSLSDRIPDIDLRILKRTVFYTETLGVPKARDQDSPGVMHGVELFIALNCQGCHVMTLRTGTGRISELSNQVIHPFSDFLLHDMGEGLSDGRSEFLATGSEWRTSPLWGIGLTSLALGGGEESYLHDGRARSLEEAILWHGGEAASAQEGFKSLSAQDRDALVQFLKSL